MSKYHPFGATTYTLGTSIGSTDTTILLSSFTEPVTGTPYTMALLETDIAFGTIAPKTISSEFISFTGITQNANHTALLTGVTRGLAKKYPFTEDVAYKLPHSGQTQFIISDVPQVFEEYPVKSNDETITGTWTFTVFPVTPATPLATEVSPGMVELSLAAGNPLFPIVVGDNDPRIPTLDEKAALAGTTGTPNGTNQYVTTTDPRVSTIPVVNVYEQGDSPATWTKPANLKYVIVEVQAAGGGAGSSYIDGGTSGGGGGGAYSRKLIPEAGLGVTETLTIGAGGIDGNGSSNPDEDGGDGEDSSFGAIIVCGGGKGSLHNGDTGGDGGTATGGDINITGGKGLSSKGNSTYFIMPGGQGGSSFFGNGGAGSYGSAGQSATSFGGGGGGSGSSGSTHNGGSGANGVIIVTEYFN